MAMGILMIRTGCTREDAFGMLTAASQRENRKLRDISAAIVVDVDEG